MRAWNASKADTIGGVNARRRGGACGGATGAELVVENQQGDPRISMKAEGAGDSEARGLERAESGSTHHGSYDDMPGAFARTRAADAALSFKPDR